MGACCSANDDEPYNIIVLESPVIESLNNGALFVHGRHNGKTYFFTIESKACRLKRGAESIKVYYRNVGQSCNVIGQDSSKRATVIQLKEVAKVQSP